MSESRGWSILPQSEVVLLCADRTSELQTGACNHSPLILKLQGTVGETSVCEGTLAVTSNASARESEQRVKLRRI